jgi:endogenous inhibitor of DNA gyrase (YacG/DUF329 family)
MSRIECPSKSWERYYASQEEAETCPHCGRSLFDEEGEEVAEFAPHLPYCSASCAEADDETLRQLAEAEAAFDRQLAEAEALLESLKH